MTARLDGAMVLVVDDHDDVGEIFKIVLQNAGAIPVVVPSVEEALMVVDSLICDAVVTDIRMRDHDGFWLVEQLRKRPARIAAIPVIAVSGHPPPTATPGFARWLMKPVEPDALVAAIAAVLGRG